MNFSFLDTYWQFFLKGTEITLLLSVFAVTLGTILGIFIVLIDVNLYRHDVWGRLMWSSLGELHY